MLRIILSVVAGFITWTVLWLASNAAASALMPSQFTADGATENTGILAAFVVLSFVFSVFAGYTAASLARGAAMKAAWVLGIVQLIVGIGVQASFWDTLPVWYHLTFLVLLLPGILIGARMRSARVTAAA